MRNYTVIVKARSYPAASYVVSAASPLVAQIKAQALYTHALLQDVQKIVPCDVLSCV